ncbi:MAG: N-acetyltransferase [Bacteroidales bacterium]|nr:N-acetyltransferase [Bacteroidales bacterium]
MTSTRYTFRKYRDKDRPRVTAVLNHYIREGFAAYPERELKEEHLSELLDRLGAYPAYVVELGDSVIGFGILHRYHPAETFSHTAEITYFILPEHTGKGLGSQLLDILLTEGAKIGIRNILASISSKNIPSINFHLKYGFTECGRFRDAGLKFGQYFDVVWMQRRI